MSFEDKVKKLAYELYEKNGRREGRDLLDWLAAEQILRFEQTIFRGVGGEGVYLLEYRPLSNALPMPKSPVKPGTRLRKAPAPRRSEAVRRGLQA
jgi:hypothetical protein